MAWLICGSVPDKNFSLERGKMRLENGQLHFAGSQSAPVAICRGTPALVATALITCQVTGALSPEVMLCPDCGDGAGSRRLYVDLACSLQEGNLPTGITFHYLFPDLDGHGRVFAALEACQPRPKLVADAGFMYVAKMSGYAHSYDLFTPDAGELAFLADELAPHPFYTRGFLLSRESEVPELIGKAYAHGDAARFLLVKGACDRVVREGQVVHEIASPLVAALEAIGGTGDVVTGLVTGLLASGMDMERACFVAARAGRLAGALARPTPATQVAELLPFLPEALQKVLHGGQPEGAEKL